MGRQMSSGTLKRDFLSWDEGDQEDCISEHIPDYEERLYGDGYIGCSYPVERIDFEEYREYAEDYDVVSTIASQCDGLSERRTEEINAGHALSDLERECLADAIAEDDPDGWITHHGFELRLKGGKVFTYYTGKSLGQGGSTFTYQGAFKNRVELVESIAGEYALVLEPEPKPKYSLFSFMTLIILMILASPFLVIQFIEFAPDPEWAEYCETNYPDTSYEECRKRSGEGAW